MTEGKWRILGRLLKHQLRVLVRLAGRHNTRSGGSCCSREGVHDCRTDLAVLAHGARPAKRRPCTSPAQGVHGGDHEPLHDPAEGFSVELASTTAGRVTSEPDLHLDPQTSADVVALPPYGHIIEPPNKAAGRSPDRLAVKRYKVPAQGIHDALTKGFMRSKPIWVVLPRIGPPPQDGDEETPARRVHD
jgi:hypothetical protein